MKLTKKEALQQDYYYKLIDEQNDDVICRTTDLNEVKKETYAYHKCCDGEWMPLCLKFKVVIEDNKRVGKAVAEYNPYTKKLLMEF